MPHKKTTVKIAYITPYYKESMDVLERCIESVEAQTIKSDHFLISDGYPQEWVGGRVARHIKLGKSHGDYGNTPRGLGAQLAVSEGYDAIGFLDADNWIDPTHTEECLATAIWHYGSFMSCDYVVARRRFIRPDLTVIDTPEEHNFVDTNCYFLLRGAYSVIPTWNLMPKEFSSVCDRVFGKRIKEAGLNSATNKNVTVNYLTLWPVHYTNAGEIPPPEATHHAYANQGTSWLADRKKMEQILLNRQAGTDLSTLWT
jgi:glycosyltransferase involved in cell wall biosynthesis